MRRRCRLHRKTRATIIRLSTPVLWLGACHSNPAQAASQDCVPTTAESSAPTATESLAGDYRLRLVATSGAKTGATVTGSLRLQPQDSVLRYRVRSDGVRDSTVVHPLFGAVHVNLDSIDAVAIGSTTSLDPTHPGVLVMERRSAPGRPAQTDIIMRLGSDANRRDRVRFDGGYTALRVKEVGPEGIAGTWASGVTAERSAGYFCASRVK